MGFSIDVEAALHRGAGGALPEPQPAISLVDDGLGVPVDTLAVQLTPASGGTLRARPSQPGAFPVRATVRNGARLSGTSPTVTLVAQ